MFKNINFKFVEKTKLWVIISSSVIALALIMILIIGLITDFKTAFSLGLDFTGGRNKSVRFGEEILDQKVYKDIEKDIKGIFADNGIKVLAVDKDGESASLAYLFRYGNKINGKNASEQELLKLDEVIDKEISDYYKNKFGTVLEPSAISTKSVSATVSGSVIWKALLAAGIAVVLTFAYITVRFKFSFSTGVCAAAALVCAAVLMYCLTVIFRVPANTAYIAGLLAVAVYSVYNTVLVLDRIKENQKQDKEKSFTEISNKSIKEMLTRFLYTSAAILIILILLLIIGVPSVRLFILPVIFGLIAGTCSSIFLAVPVWAVFKDKQKEKRKKTGYADKTDKQEKKPKTKLQKQQ